MNPRDEWLAAAFRSRADDSFRRSDCPTAERIWDAARVQIPLDERLETIDHVSQCAACAEAWSLASELAAAEVESSGEHAIQSSVQTDRRSEVKHWNVFLVAAPVVALVAIGISLTTMWSPHSEETVPSLR